MPDYQKGCIYKLVHKEDYDNRDIYIGSTTNFKVRKNLHKTTCNNPDNKEYDRTLYQFIRNNDGFENWIMIQLEAFPCDGKRDIETRERYYIDLLKPNLNKNIPTRTDKEYRQMNKEKLAEYLKEYRETHKEKAAEYRETHKEKIAEWHIEKIECPNCKCLISRRNLAKHKRTTKCTNANKETISVV